jgi:ABC-type transport system involved in multi-copper enzyme maturation permease subunit
MIAMRIFITFLLALGFCAPLNVFVNEKGDWTRTFAAFTVFALYVTGIVFAWII